MSSNDDGINGIFRIVRLDRSQLAAKSHRSASLDPLAATPPPEERRCLLSPFRVESSQDIGADRSVLAGFTINAVSGSPRGAFS